MGQVEGLPIIKEVAKAWAEEWVEVIRFKEEILRICRAEAAPGISLSK